MKRWIGSLAGVAAVALVATAAWYALLRASGAPGPQQEASCRTVPVGEVWIPDGAYRMGSDGGDGRFAEEVGGPEVQVAGFWMDRTEVTNAQFAAFVAATGYVTAAERNATATGEAVEPGAAVFVAPESVRDLVDISQWWRFVPGANWRHPKGPGSSIDRLGHHPVVALALEDAVAYATWAGREIPTEAEWEWAARESAADENWDEPKKPDGTFRANTWQGVFPVRNIGDDGYLVSAPVGCFPANARGLYDMVGNVWEWTGDGFGSPLPGALPQHVIKGGSYLCAPNYCARYRPTARQPADADLGTSHIGFRTIRRGSPPPA